MNIKKIVVGIDFSEESDIATRQAMSIARHVGAEVVLLHVGAVLDAPMHLGSSMHASVREWETLMRSELAEDRRRLSELRERLHGQGVEVSHLVRDGFADTGLTEAARELGADLLVVGTHGRTGIKRFFLGSISERVARLSSTAVMVARPTAHVGGGYRRILVPTDFSEPAARALDTALELAGRDARIDLVHFWQVPVMATTPYAPFKAAEEAMGTMRQAMAEAAEDMGESLRERHARTGVELTFHAIEGEPAHSIQEHLEESDYDLVVMGSHGRRGLRRFLLGSVTEFTVRHAPCSVMVVHGDGAHEAGEDPIPTER